MATPKNVPTKAQTAAGMSQTAIDTGIPAPQATADVAQNAAGTAMQASRPSFVLEDDVPYPTRTFGGARQTTSIYPFATMAIGQSFFVGSTEKMEMPWKTLTSLASRETRKQYPKVFVTGKEAGKDGKQGVRVWRKPDTTEPLKEAKKRTPKAPSTDAAQAQPGTQEPQFT